MSLTIPQIEAFAVIGAMLGLFVWDRLRYDLVAASALAVAALLGIVPANRAFTGFSNPVIIIIASVLVLGRAIAASGVIEAALGGALRRLGTISLQVGALTACVTFLSAFLKNVGTLGIFMPIAIRTAERNGRSPSSYLMPLAFGSLIGGTITLIGTSPNLLISSIRRDVTGHPYRMFDFSLVGLPLSVLAVVFLAFGWRLIPRGTRAAAPASGQRYRIEDYTSENAIPAGSPLIGKTVGELEAAGDGDIAVAAVLRPRGNLKTENSEVERRSWPPADFPLQQDDMLLLQADPTALAPLIDSGQLEMADARKLPPSREKDDGIETVEAVVKEESRLIGQTSAALHLRRRYEVNVLAIGRHGQRIATRVRNVRFRAGDMLVLQGRAGALAEVLTAFDCLPLAERRLRTTRQGSGAGLIAILVVTMGLTAFDVLPVEIAFFTAAVLVVLLGMLPIREAYTAIDWPIIVMIGCLIPVGEALQSTGAAGLIGAALTHVASHMPGWLAVGMMLVTAMLVTPFLHHAAAVLVLGPVAAAVALNLGYAPDPFLMATALGASCDFLTPIGHQNNLLVMEPGGYRFSDYWRLGLPLSILVAVFGTWLIVAVWPL